MQGLTSEHLGAGHENVELGATFATLTASAGALQGWHERGRVSPRPPERLRPLTERARRAFTSAWADPLYRLVYDPDGRPLGLRLRQRM